MAYLGLLALSLNEWWQTIEDGLSCGDAVSMFLLYLLSCYNYDVQRFLWNVN